MYARCIRWMIGLLPLLFVMTMFGTDVSAAQTSPATLTKATTWIEDLGGPGTPQGKQYHCEFWIDNPSEDSIKVWIKWEGPFTFVGYYSTATIHDVGAELVNEQAGSITVRGENMNTNKIDFEVIVPMPGSWP